VDHRRVGRGRFRRERQRGFRRLAQRSADAAKEIRTLINKSATCVGAGVDLVGSSGDAFTKIAAQIADVSALGLPPQAHLRALIERFMQAYAHAQHEHRVLTEDVRFLADAERGEVVAAQRRVVAAFADAVVAVRPALAQASLGTPLAMLLFGMINWTFTWLRPGGSMTHESLAPVVAELFLGGLPAVG
jgi:TetR/AcrR family transcriptional regulator